MGTSASVIEDFSERPAWTKVVQFNANFYNDKILDTTRGFRQINNNSVELTLSTKGTVECVRWSRGFNTGKHVIEFIFPVRLRGRHARVGLGPDSVIQGASNDRKWQGTKGTYTIDLTTGKAYQDQTVVGRLPGTSVMPDWFFMFVDMDNGTVQFGSDHLYFGTAFTNVNVTNESLYPIATASVTGAIIGIIYRGQGKEVNGPLRKKRSIIPEKLHDVVVKS
ncbi:protein gustavus-like [Dreissena polymorpha]|uniref:B30.2/SPRY domain-containing protein n=1 Tax=Dreissena polymorpha TaxID=45954 RepID=A0A9D3YLL4_DREPO|nr:protein gustavus-like [Dreissena polymorpha]KAH3700721.1 hypothetical protein DPMN_075700 [Dreissena polymorpha]